MKRRTRPPGRPLRFTPAALADLFGVCVRALPKKCFGFVAGRRAGFAEEVHPMRRNLRDRSAAVDRFFLSYGPFYRRRDRGFCFDPREVRALISRLDRRGLRIVAVFHSHRSRGLHLSRVDVDLHYSPRVYSVVVSVVDPRAPRIKAFAVRGRTSTPIAITVPVRDRR